MKTYFTIRAAAGAAIALVLVVTLSLISYRIIDAYCDLGESFSDPDAPHDFVKTQMQDLKDWGGLVLGFFFGAAFNFVTFWVVGKKLDEPRALDSGGG